MDLMDELQTPQVGGGGLRKYATLHHRFPCIWPDFLCPQQYIWGWLGAQGVKATRMWAVEARAASLAAISASLLPQSISDVPF